MKPESQRIAIAEACGWLNIEMLPALRDPFTNDNNYLGSLPKPCGRFNGKFSELPDYLNDLNAMHEAEKVLEPWPRLKFLEELRQVVRVPKDHENDLLIEWQLITTTAAQRAEAFLKTLGLWQE